MAISILEWLQGHYFFVTLAVKWVIFVSSLNLFKNYNGKGHNWTNWKYIYGMSVSITTFKWKEQIWQSNMNPVKL